MFTVNNKYKKEIFKALSFAFFLMLILSSSFLILEPSLTGAADDTDAVDVTLAVTSTISLDSPSNLALDDIPGTGATADEYVTWTVTTNNSSGWKLEVNAGTDPAMLGVGSTANQFANYTEGTPGTPEAWSVAASAAEFGFGATGTYKLAKFDTDKYMGFATTTKEEVATRAAASAGGGDATAVHFKAEVGSSKFQPSDTYKATITATATTLP